MSGNNKVLVLIVLAQFCCTSIWFAGNAVISNVIEEFSLSLSALGHLTSAVQFGFIFGTLAFALFGLADRYSPSKVFFISALLGATFNIGTTLEINNFISLFSFRFLSGFFLAGIYPVGMKIAADHYEKVLGKSLGFLVGALVLGTAFPHLLKGVLASFPWKMVIYSTSILAATGGLMMFLLVPNGPYQNPSKKLDFSTTYKVFRNKDFRTAAFGYFGHMWELYAFWAFVPVLLKTYIDLYPQTNFDIPILSFAVIGIGSLGCILGAYVAPFFGTAKTAFWALFLSAACCLLSPIMFGLSETLFLAFLFLWGMLVIADSPLFSTLVAQKAQAEIKGTALTIVNCIGFSITILSIQLLNGLAKWLDPKYIYLVLALGPILSLFSLRRIFIETIRQKH